MRLPDNIQQALQADDDDLISWTVILHFFSENKHKLTYTQKQQLYIKSEQFRKFWNTPKEYDIELKRPNGDIMKLKRVRDSLQIEINDLKPNDLYQDQTILDNPLKIIIRQFLTNILQFFSNTATTK